MRAIFWHALSMLREPGSEMSESLRSSLSIAALH